MEDSFRLYYEKDGYYSIANEVLILVFVEDSFRFVKIMRDINPDMSFIEAGSHALMMTITKSEREMDSDDERSYFELCTKTDDTNEIDDEKFGMNPLLDIHYCRELVSKTFADRERDDEDDVPSLLLLNDSHICASEYTE